MSRERDSPSGLSGLFRSACTAFTGQDAVQQEQQDLPVDFEGTQYPLSDNQVAGSFEVVQPDIRRMNTEEEEFDKGRFEMTSSETPAPGPSTPQLKTVTINGHPITVAATPQTVSAGNTPLYKKENRINLSEDKRNNLFDKATKTRSTKFDLVPLTLSEEDKLDDTYNLGIQIAQLQSHFIKYDMDDVFTIVYPDQRTPGINSSRLFSNLFVEYSTLQVKYVANSNRWYNEHTHDEYHRQNLQLSFNFFENNCTKGLWEKCLEDYNEYEPEEKGGPLLFIIMMKKLQSHTDSAVQYLINSVKNLKISNFEGENVSRVVSLIRGANKRLRNVTTLPEEFPKWVLLVFQTSTVDDFNKVFAHLKGEIEVVRPLMSSSTRPNYPTVEEMLHMAEKLYLDMTAANEWSGVTTKAGHSAFVAGNHSGTGAGVRKLTCWNCGVEGHSLKECPKPSNPAMVEKHKKAFTFF
jgi:Zinc knuckle